MCMYTWYEDVYKLCTYTCNASVNVCDSQVLGVCGIKVCRHTSYAGVDTYVGG